MKCAPNKVMLFWSRELDPTEREEVVKHLKSCGQCREILGELEFSNKAAEAIEMHTPSRDLALAALTQVRWQRSARPVLLSTAGLAAAAALLLCILVQNRQGPDPKSATSVRVAAEISGPSTVISARRLAMSPVVPDMELDQRLSTVRKRMKRLRAGLEPRVRRGARSGQRPNPTGVLEMAGLALPSTHCCFDETGRAGRVESHSRNV